MTESDSRTWASHLAPLVGCVAATRGTVLELGVGHFSTPVLHTLCQADPSRLLVSVESNPNYFDEMSHRFATRRHLFDQSDYLLAINRFPVKPDTISVAFLDCSPGGDYRARCFAALLPICEFVVVHDMQEHGDNWPAIKPLLPGCVWHRCSVYHPDTLVASVRREPPESVLCL